MFTIVNNVLTILLVFILYCFLDALERRLKASPGKIRYYVDDDNDDVYY